MEINKNTVFALNGMFDSSHAQGGGSEVLHDMNVVPPKTGCSDRSALTALTAACMTGIHGWPQWP